MAVHDCRSSTARSLIALRRYQSPDEDSGRWEVLRWRAGDIVISTRSKHGTTWLQMICALLVFQTPELPAPLPRLSPWVDWLGVPIDELVGRLEAQEHRRFVKTHTPLRDWLRDWIESDADPHAELDSLPGVIAHLRDAWQRRHEPNVVLVHYTDLTEGLDAEMRRLGDRLGIAVDESTWPELVRAASFEQMRARANEIAPAFGVLKSSEAFFRRGTPGAGSTVLRAAEVSRYDDRVAAHAESDLLAWINR